MGTGTENVHHLLRRLGVTANYTGFFYLAHALQLCAEKPERLLLVTKWLYPDVAKHYKTNWKAVERNIRTVGRVIWRCNRPLLEELAHRPLAQKPCTAQMLSILYTSLSPHTDGLGEAGERSAGNGERPPPRPDGEGL